MKRTALLAVVLPLLCVGVGAAQASGGRVKVVSDCIHARYKPSHIVIACGDGNFALTKIAYSSWGHLRAKGTDRTFENSCTPDCASGSPVYHHDHFTLDRPRTKNGVRVFTRVRVYRHGTLYQTDPLGSPSRRARSTTGCDWRPRPIRAGLPTLGMSPY